ncbi:hypothetical protein AAY473_014942, partial [Plecturocebus cupreus]
MKSRYIPQAGLKLLASRDHPTLASKSAGIIDVDSYRITSPTRASKKKQVELMQEGDFNLSKQKNVPECTEPEIE